MPNRNEDMIADYNFIKNNYSGGWVAKGGLGETLTPISGSFNWVYDKVPSKVDYNS